MAKAPAKVDQRTFQEKAVSFAIDFALGGISGAVAKTMTAPIERVKLIIQTQVPFSIDISISYGYLIADRMPTLESFLVKFRDTRESLTVSLVFRMKLSYTCFLLAGFYLLHQ